ncbi:MAG: hypothetical protein HY017_25995 [Betaproteobacteria bacterium]|nr:hypothetical protein [Betaproteobacteria bacterium]
MVLALLAPGETGAQSLADLHPGAWGGSLEMGYGTDHQQLRSSDASPGIDSARRRTQERLAIRNEGFSFLHPGLLSGNLGLTFGLVQDRDNTNGTVNSREAKLTGYAFDSTLFSAFPYNGTLYANRTQNLLSQPFGRTDIAFENRGAAFRLREDSPLRDWGFPYFSANVRAEQQHTQEATTSVLGQTFRRDEMRNVLSVDGHKGFETSDLDLRYEFNDLNNAAFPSGNFQSQTANLNYSRDFGPALNRRSDTRLFYYTRSGVSPFSLFTADQRLRIDHLQNLSTNYSYVLAHTDTLAGASTTHNGVFDVRHVPFRDLTATAQLSGLHQELPAGVRDSYAGQLALQYHRDLPGSGTVFARASGRYQLNDNQLRASQITVTDEAQGAPTPLGAGAGFLLNQSFVVASSIVVVDTRGGARLATSPGIDYDVLGEGNLIRIIPLPTSAVIRPGDPLAISYTYELDPSLKYSTNSRSVSGGVDFRWIALSYGHEQSEQTLLSGQDSRFLQDLRRDTAQLDLRGAWKTLQGQAGAAYVRYDSTRLAYIQQRYTQIASYRPTRRLSIAFNADRTLTEFTLPAHQTDARSIRLTLDWYGAEGLTTTALLGRRVYKDSLQPMETINEASLKARLLYGKLDLASSFTASERIRGGFQTVSWRLDFLATRRF